MTMIRHVVMWKFQSENKERNLQKAKTDLLALRDKIEVIRDIEVELDFGHSDASFDICLIVTLDSKEDLEIYRNHPEHQAVGRFIGRIRTERAVVDYNLGA